MGNLSLETRDPAQKISIKRGVEFSETRIHRAGRRNPRVPLDTPNMTLSSPSQMPKMHSISVLLSGSRDPRKGIRSTWLNMIGAPDSKEMGKSGWSECLHAVMNCQILGVSVGSIKC